MKRPSPGQHLWFSPVRTNQQCDDVLDETVRWRVQEMSTTGEVAGGARRRPSPNTLMIMMKDEDTPNDTSSGSRRRREDSPLDGADIASNRIPPPPSPPDRGGEREGRRLRLQRSPPPVKKCRICFQTDILNERALAVGKGSVRGLGTLLHGLKLWNWNRRRGAQAAIVDDGFISPCACKGSMAWVHRQCLEEWRYKSARRDSFYNCEYCFAAYRFKHTWLAAFLNNPFTLLLVTLLVTGLTALGIVFLAGAIFPLRLADLAEQLTVGTGSIGDRVNNVGGDNRGIFGVDGIWVTVIPPTATKYRRVTRSDILPTITAPAAVATTKAPEAHTVSNASTPSVEGNHAKAADPTRTSRQTILGGRKGDRLNLVGARGETRMPAHSPVSYFNIAYWLTGHSMDEREEEQNDFLLAMMDVSTIKLWLVALAGLGLVALVRDFTAWSLLVALCLVFGLTGLYQSSPASGISALVWIFFPVPALLGIYRYVCWQYEGVESFMDVIIKNFSAELENYQSLPSSSPAASLSS